MDIKDYNKVQINYTTRRDSDDNVVDRNVMINIRTESVDEAFELYSNLRQKLNGQLDSNSGKQTEVNTQSESGKTCPNCGRVLVRRKAKNGDAFLGCVGYPKCRFTQTM
ncbi:topoisomerase DNA-binding C4 zinc finger domain-containing protein [Patescibacteria group bacterium]|nr:topoisomerase DNA-binding C4 zinc finger domain-containing protein [Patescibacteria group bacterium]